MANTVFVGINRKTDTATVTENDLIVARATRIWVEMLPDADVPDEGQFFRWLDNAANNAATLFRGINRASKKQRREAGAGIEMTRDDLGRYVTSVIAKERDGTGKRTFPPNKNLNRVGIRRL
jgi:hypothetical protein